jgi:Xaa-Pro aminopeptidase
MTRTFHIGEPSDGFRHVYEIVNEANQKAFEAVRPGVPAEEIDAVARNHIAAAGYGPRFLHRTGHGIGLDTHEPPYIVSGNRTPLDVGMTFSIEPGIYLEGQYGVRIEDIAVVTQGGAERLNTSTHQLQII